MKRSLMWRPMWKANPFCSPRWLKRWYCEGWPLAYAGLRAKRKWQDTEEKPRTARQVFYFIGLPIREQAMPPNKIMSWRNRLWKAWPSWVDFYFLIFLLFIEWLVKSWNLFPHHGEPAPWTEIEKSALKKEFQSELRVFPPHTHLTNEMWKC